MDNCQRCGQQLSDLRYGGLYLYYLRGVACYPLGEGYFLQGEDGVLDGGEWHHHALIHLQCEGLQHYQHWSLDDVQPPSDDGQFQG